ncbi:MAG: thermonuclease family protein [Minwuia sp.]|uniref:thermonuclease family protein n=1 Tax=Minwuia sp. TaxID=2493630 RepID=UPI003A85A725
MSAILFFWACVVSAEQLPGFEGLPGRAGGTVTEVIDGDTVVLSNGDEVRMVGIQAPKLPLGRAGFRTWPLAEEAKSALEALSRNRRFDAYFGGQRKDRHGRALAHLVSPDGIWLQGEMLRLGMARVYSFPDNRALIDEMLQLEREARAGSFGIWSHPFYRVLTLSGLEDRAGTFQIVEGTVADAADVRGTVYLNFGADWRTDFTVAIRKPARRLFEADDPASWTGRALRVRGWLRERNGPMIEATHPEQIELRKEQE